MFLTLEYLEKNNACENGKKWFAKFFPDGAELTDILQHRAARFSPEFLHWGYNHLVSTPEEREMYWQAVKVDCENRDTIFQSDHVTNSEFISRSSNVEDSRYIFSSKKIKKSHAIISGNNVEDSSEIYTGEFIYESKRVINGNNITKSFNIANSSNVINSQSVLFGKNILNSKFVIGLFENVNENLDNCYFINKSKNLKNCMFCTESQDAEYMVFNKKVTQQQFDIYLRQLLQILENYNCDLTEEWPECNIPMNHPNIIERSDKYYNNLPEDFWNWVKTLPGYSARMLYKITFNPSLIKEF